MDGGSGMSKVVTMKKTTVANVEDGDLPYIGDYVCRTLFAAVRPTMTMSTFFNHYVCS